MVAVLGGAAVAMTVRPSDSSGASSPLCRDTSRRFLPRWFIPSVLFLSSPRLSLSISQSIFPCFFCVSQFRSFLSLPSRFLSLCFPPFSCRLLSFLGLFPFFPFFFFCCTQTVFIGAGGAGTTLPRPIAAHGVGSRRSTLSQHRLRRLMGTSLAGHGLSVFSS